MGGQLRPITIYGRSITVFGSSIMVTQGQLRSIIVKYPNLRPFPADYGLCPVNYGRLWSLKVDHDQLRPITVNYGHLRSFTANYSQVRPLDDQLRSFDGRLRSLKVNHG